MLDGDGRGLGHAGRGAEYNGHWPMVVDRLEAPPLTQRRLLLVEDEPDVAAFLVDLLALDGWAVDIARNGRQALARLEWDTYDVVISDLVMPEMDGATLYREIARRRPELLPRFIFVSGFADSDIADFIRQARAPMISKPFRFEEIQQAIDDVVGGPADVTD